MNSDAIWQAVSRPGHALAVQAWIIDARGRDVEITGAAIAWTSRTVHVRYTDPYGREGTVWVWASAVSRARLQVDASRPIRCRHGGRGRGDIEAQ